MIIVIFYQLLLLISIVETLKEAYDISSCVKKVDQCWQLFVLASWQRINECCSVPATRVTVKGQSQSWSASYINISISLTLLASFSLLQYPSYNVTTDTVQLSRYPEYSLKSHWYLQLCSVLEMAPVTDNNTLHCTVLVWINCFHSGKYGLKLIVEIWTEIVRSDY